MGKPFPNDNYKASSAQPIESFHFDCMEVPLQSPPAMATALSCLPSSFLRIRPFEYQRLSRKILRKSKQQKWVGGNSHVSHASLLHKLSRKGVHSVAEEPLLEMKSEGFLGDSSSFAALLLIYADNGLLPQAKAIWDEILNSCFIPDALTISKLFDAYGKMGRFDEVTNVLNQLKPRNLDILPKAFSSAIACFGKRGELELMEETMREMILCGVPVDSATANSFLVYYSKFGSLSEMETAYGRLKRSQLLIEKEAIRAMSRVYIKKRKFYRLGEFLRDIGLGRNNVGNLLWNLLLLSYAANFKMKSLQREFLNMVEAKFSPDLTTFNIRALAYSRMTLFWDLHLSLEHMKHENVVPDLVTYGCIIDAYLDRRLGRNLDFALRKMNVDHHPVMLTDSLTFEAMGKGDFHLSAESFSEFRKLKEWTYRELIATYLKKKFRSNQVFWNY